MPLAVIGCWRVTTRPPIRTGPGRRSASARVRHRAEPVEHAAVQPDHLAPGVEPDHRVGVADPLRLGEAGQRRRVGRRQAEVHRPDAARVNAAARVERPSSRARSARDLAELPEELAPRPAQRVQRPDPDQPLERLLRQARPLDDVRERACTARAPAPRRAAPRAPRRSPSRGRSPSRTPQPTALSAAHCSRASREGITQAAERTGSGRRSMPASPGSGSSGLVASPIAQPGRPDPLGRRLVAATC